ncbi:hypothetical protein KMW28_04070 [Flammeovirga yaeyamensis]|uniref:Uncharacterized protein n=1 Tax=Flammeovirga yaeyamensis TaxID=367791 RepID=A0AAX1N5K7_9BACT|nr:hypothetical protein [Flammeovirga yaeyamensis]MBB3697331.1 uncharacterized protein (UPF0335 family) [Flammeovirga yaeyamensis]NMF36025.1 hypothetical protein [Flammeovirga yaeyamensis]QWG02760.1 hypothetical protein KMW28_04070 [Flammeovirga yaeyamensis]
MNKSTLRFITFLLFIGTSLSSFGQQFVSLEKELFQKEEQLKVLLIKFEEDSAYLQTMIDRLDRQKIRLIHERDSISQLKDDLMPHTKAFGIVKKDISITSKTNQKDYYFNKGEKLALIDHSRHTYSFITENNVKLTINKKFIKPADGRRDTMYAIAFYHNRVEDYDNFVATLPTESWYAFDLERKEKERSELQNEYTDLVNEISMLKFEIKQLKKKIVQKNNGKKVEV